ncbi:MAG: hypothetical protein V4819_00645 [Verrucomicrobiota bacterium]
MKSLIHLTALLSALAAAGSASAAMVAAEYFIDVDPGQGNGILVALANPADPAALVVDVPAPVLAALALGEHRLAVRWQDEQGDWSEAFSRTFCKEVIPVPRTPPVIVAAEYFIDVDPGQGLGTPVSIPVAGESKALQIDVPTPLFAALSVGEHRLSVRMRDDSGNWSEAFARTFRKDDVTASLPERLLARVEYQWFLANVPVGSPTALEAAPPATQSSFIVNPSLQGLTEGFTYQLVITPIDNQGNLGESITRQVAVQTTDTDEDGLPDRWEVAAGLNPDEPADAGVDSDGDGLTNLQEFLAKTDPQDKDTSDDGLSDKFAIDLGLNPLAANPQLRAAIMANSQELGLASESQIRTLSPGTPILARNPATGKFTLRIGFAESASLNQWTKLPLVAADSVVSDGWLDFSFSSTQNTMFYRVSAGTK